MQSPSRFRVLTRSAPARSDHADLLLRFCALQLIGMFLLEQTEDWHADKRYMSAASMAQLYANETSG
jgi:hypothetical protein